jgi:hypothetical protein
MMMLDAPTWSSLELDTVGEFTMDRSSHTAILRDRLGRLSLNSRSILAAALVAMTWLPGPASASNPIVLENTYAGTLSWQLGPKQSDDVTSQIKGFASATSVNKGQAITFRVTVHPAQTFTIDIYRVGWYGGTGGRLLISSAPIAGISQPGCTPSPATLDVAVECHWSSSYSVTIPTSWTSGVYLAKLTNAAGYQNYSIFVVRDDDRTADFVYQLPVTTYAAYNDYGNSSLYLKINGLTMARVSFDRPYRSDGSGDGDGSGLFAYDQAFVRWMEMNGYDVTYTTSVDTHVRTVALPRYRAFINSGHDEYWSRAMYDTVQGARDSGVQLGFFSGNTIFWQIRFENSTSAAPFAGVPNRIIVCYKDKGRDLNAGHTDPYSMTARWRDLDMPRPEQQLVGVQFGWQENITNYPSPAVPGIGQPPAPYETVGDESNWVYASLNVSAGQSLTGLRPGYEFDADYSEPSAPVHYDRPANRSYSMIASTLVPMFYLTPTLQDSDSTAVTSLYQADSGSWVFGAGSIYWGSYLCSKGLGIVCPAWSSPYVPIIAKNILDRFAGTTGVSWRQRPQVPIMLGLLQ